MKKIILTSILFLLGLSSVSALSYNGIDTVVYPPLKSSFGKILSQPSYNWAGTITVLTTVSWTTPQYNFTQLWCFDYKAIQGSWVALSWQVFEFVAPWENQLTASMWWNYDMRAPVKVIATTLSGNETMISLKTTNYTSVWGTTTLDLMRIPTYPNSLGWDTSKGSFCVAPTFWLLPRYQTDEGIYLHSVRFSYYHGSTWVFWYAQKFYTWFWIYWYKFADFSIIPLWDPNAWWHSFQLPFFTKWASTSTGTLITYSSFSGWSFQSDIWGDDVDRFLGSTLPVLYSNCIPFVNGVGWYADNCYSTGMTNMGAWVCYTLQTGRPSNTQYVTWDASDTYWWKPAGCNTPFVNTSLPVWFASDFSSTWSTNTWQVNTWSTNTGSTGNTDTSDTWDNTSFDDCTSFLSVGCYLEVIYYKFTSAITSKIKEIFDYFIPDISFTGNSSTCMGGSGSLTASGWLGFTQKFVNLFVVAVPIAPPDWSIVCTLNWQKTIDYWSSSPWFIDIILIFVCILPIFFGARFSSNKPS